jgi:acetyl esterase/lipase
MQSSDWRSLKLIQGLFRRGAVSRRQRDRAFRPDATGPLEGRVLMSAVVLDGRSSTGPAGHASVSVPLTGETIARRSSQVSMGAHLIEESNLPYPTPAGPSEDLNVYLPQGPVPPGGRPVLIAIHGGGWRRLDKAGYGDRIASAFVSRGYVVVAPNYMLSAPGRPSWPVNLEDVQAVVGWVRTHSDALGINPNQVAAIGESAGANLAALLGTDPGPVDSGDVSTQVEAVIAFSTPTDLSELDAASPLAGRAAAQFLGGSPQQVPASYAAASPIDHVAPGDPPMLLVHGLEDPLIPVSQSEAMAAALTAAGVRNELILVPGGHDLDFPVHYAKLIPRLLEFLGTTWNDE